MQRVISLRVLPRGRSSKAKILLAHLMRTDSTPKKQDRVRDTHRDNALWKGREKEKEGAGWGCIAKKERVRQRVEEREGKEKRKTDCTVRALDVCIPRNYIQNQT